MGKGGKDFQGLSCRFELCNLTSCGTIWLGEMKEEGDFYAGGGNSRVLF